MVLEKVLAILVRRTVRQEGGWCDRRLVLEALQEELAGLLPADRLDHLLDDAVLSGAWPLEAHAGRVIDVTLAERYVFTHRLSAEEISSGALDVDVDLAAISRLAECDGGLHTEDGVRLHHRVRRRKGAGREGLDLRTATVTGPTGWLGRFTADTVVAVRAAGGFLTLEPVEGELSAPEDVVSALASLMERAHEGDGTPVDAAELQFAAMVDHPEWFAVPRPPFTTLLEQAGFEVDGDLVGRPGGWADYKALTDMIGAIAGNDLPEHDTSILLDGLKAFDKWKDEGRRPAPELSQRLGRHWAAATALSEELRRRRTSPDDLAGFAATLEPPIREWLGAKAAVLQGRTADAEQLAREALRADAGFGPALRLMATFESDRGHAREAVNLLHRVVPHDDAHLITLRRYASAASPSTGRNDPCPCGSGRKFKVCHLGRSLLPDAERVRWLLDKVWLYTVSLNPSDQIDELLGADVMAGAIRLDLLVFDEGWLQRFILERGSLLPDTERHWAERWCTENVPSVYRLEEVDADGRAVLIDVGTGQRYVVESPALQDFTPGRLLWARLLPVDDKWWTSGIVRPVWLSERADLLAAMAEGTPIDQRYDALAPEDMGPTLTNTSGDPHVFCTTTVVVADPELAVKALDDRLGPREGKELEWATKEDTPSMPQAVTARLELTFERLLIETNSLRRRAAVLALVEDILGPVEIVKDERVPSARARALHEAEELADDVLAEFWDDDDDDDDEFEDDEFDDESPELEQLLAAHQAALDERWLDMEIPALGGLTPRQAANDDAARADLITLLAETDDRGLSLDSGQIRRRLGLSD